MKLFIKLFLVAVVLGAGNTSYGQFRQYSKEADANWNAGLYKSAAEAYKKASEKTSAKKPKARELKAKYAYRSAESYRFIHDYASAEQQYEKAIQLKYFKTEPDAYYYLGESQMAQGKHAKALSNFKKYKQLNTGNPLLDAKIESCENYKKFLKDAGRHEMKPVTKLNSTVYDYSTTIDSRGTTIYFTSTRGAATGEDMDEILEQDFSDIFECKIDRKGNFSEPSPLPAPINTTANEGSICFDGRGKKMFFTRCVVDEAKNLGCDIYMAEKKGSRYSKPVKIELKDHDTTNVGQPCVSPDGNLMIFASNMAGGEGGIDLWFSTYNKRQDEWSLPQNLGPEINTAGDEMFPTWGAGGELYFSSNGMVGAGGLDIFRADRVGEKNMWENPVNLGAPINTYSDDYHIIFTQNDEKGTKGYISSNRPGSKGSRTNPSQDIWSFYLPPILIDLTVNVVDQDTRESVPGMEVRIVGSDGSNFIVKTDENGMVNLSKKADGSRYISQGNTYSIEVKDVKGKWLGTHSRFSTMTASKPTRIIRELGILDIDKPIRLPEVQYPLGSAELLVNDQVNSKDSLNYLYELMMEHPNIIIQLLSHTDCRGSDAANMRLSQRRAESCVNYLVNEKGLPKARLVPKGLGESTPAKIKIDGIERTLDCDFITSFENTNPRKFKEYHQKNRRTEGRVISFEYVGN